MKPETRILSEKLLFAAIALLTLAPFVSSGVGLLLGLVFALGLGNPWPVHTRRWTPVLLQLSVIGLGASMNLETVAATGVHGLLYTTIGISLTMFLGWLLGRLLKIEKATSLLVSAGTAICGGSAIAAIAPVIRAKDNEISVSLATVFFLNAAALFIFPPVGHFAAFTETQFGLWCALAIHDTSSVVGAALQYGPRAVEIATTVKLARALWIVPLTLVIGILFANKKEDAGSSVKTKKPWFILGFILMSAIMTWIPALRPGGHVIAEIAKRTMVLTLFLIGTGLSRAALKAVGVRPLIQGVLLWCLVSVGTFLAIDVGWINL